jgi:hypothetical protein
VVVDDNEPVADTPLPEDKFYRGSILRLSAGRQTGVVRTRSGRDIPFAFQFVTMLGERRRFEDLHVGTQVGFDVSWTAGGLLVSTMKILDAPLGSQQQLPDELPGNERESGRDT